MNKNNLFMAMMAVAILVGATDVAMAHGQSGPQHSSTGGTVNNNDVQKVNVKINNIVAIASNVNGNINNNIAANVNTSSSTNANTSTNTNAATNTNTGGNTNTNTSSASASATSGATASSGTNGGDGGSSDVTVEGDEASASSAAPIFLSTGDDVCMGSSSVGGQAAEFGFSVGSTWQDSNCVMLKNARELKNQGYDKAAKARLCMNEDNALAFELAGEPCPRALASTQAAIATIRASNPDYDPERVAAAAPAQLASLDRTVDVNAADRASGEQVAVLAPAGKADVEWLSGGFDSFVGAIKAFFHTLADASDQSPQGKSTNWALDLPE
jgi:hypothetical protein